MQPKKTKDETSYLEEIYGVVRQIPKGRVSTYGTIADYLGTVSARMVGWAMNKSFAANPPVPAHRVVNRKGELSGRNHFATPTLMQELLENEGITVKNHQIEDFAKVRWQPIQDETTN
jgi:methylated-DNA-protein-cysteine methyltransferase-like protein